MTEATKEAAREPITALMDYDVKFRKCPLFEMCKSPSKRNDKWACVKPMKERLQMCTSFYALAVAMNRGRSLHDNS